MSSKSRKRAVAGVCSALSVAVAATLSPSTAKSATLTLYYGQDSSYANSNNSIFISDTYNPNATAKDSVGNRQYLGPAPINVSVSQTAPTTITVPVGDYLSLAIDAVVTGAANPDGGLTTGTDQNQQVQPNFLGLASFESDVVSSSLLPAIPAATGDSVGPYSTAKINTKQGSNGGPYNVVPAWSPGATPGNVESPSVFNVYASANVAIDGSTVAGVQTAEQFASANNVASYQNATDFLDTLVFQASKPGFTTLSPQATASYWALTTPGSSTTPSFYSGRAFVGADVINQLPSLVIQIVQPHHAIIAHEPTDSTDYGSLITSGTGDHQGTFNPPDTFPPPYSSTLFYGNYLDDGYLAAEVTGINSNRGDSSGIVQVLGPDFLTPIHNGYTSIIAIDVEVNGTQASSAQLQTLLNAIDGADGSAASPCIAGVTDPSPNQLLSSLDNATTSYNLFLTFAGNSYFAGNLGIDLGNFNDPNLVGYEFTAVAVIPEPATGAVLALSLGLAARRRRHRL